MGLLVVRGARSEDRSLGVVRGDLCRRRLPPTSLRAFTGGETAAAKGCTPEVEPVEPVLRLLRPEVLGGGLVAPFRLEIRVAREVDPSSLTLAVTCRSWRTGFKPHTRDLTTDVRRYVILRGLMHGAVDVPYSGCYRMDIVVHDRTGRPLRAPSSRRSRRLVDERPVCAAEKRLDRVRLAPGPRDRSPAPEEGGFRCQ